MKNKAKHFLDLVMSVVMLFLMAYQVTGEKAHEWLGISMFAAATAHNILNLKWYSVLFKGKYKLLRIIGIAVNLLLFAALLGTAVSGILMNNYVFPLSIHGTMAAARVIHLAASHWCFVLTGIHLGLHWSMVISMFRKIPVHGGAKKAAVIILRIIAAAIAVYGGYCFVKADIFSYMTFKMHFAFLDYERAHVLVLVDNLAMLGTWVYLSYYFAKLCKFFPNEKNDNGRNKE